MKQVVMIDRGDHWHVIADYSGSMRHASLSESSWKAEFAGPDYATMRASEPGMVAVAAPQGAGRWKKDWSGPYVPTNVVPPAPAPSVPSLKIASDAALDFDKVPSVNAGTLGKHNLSIQAIGADGQPSKSSGALRILISTPIYVSNTAPGLSNGQASVTVGPCANPCDVVVAVADPSGTFGKSELKVRFK